MSNHPTCSSPNGGTVTIDIPPGWFTYVSGLARNSFNQMIRLRVTSSQGTNTEHLVHSPKESTETNETMKLRRTREDSYSMCARTDIQQLELTAYYSTDPQIKGRLLEKNNAVVHSLVVLKAETPQHLLANYPNYITFFVFIQASPDQKQTDSSPLHNDAVCTINMIRATGLDHNGFPMSYDGSVGSDTADAAIPESTAMLGRSIGGATTSRTTDGIPTDDGSDGSPSKPTLDIVFVYDYTSNREPYINALTDTIVNISSRIVSGANLAPDALRLGLVGFCGTGDKIVVKSFPLTTDASVTRKSLGTLVAAGAGTETMAEGLDAALLAEWRVDATKLVILITDPPPHGTSKLSDGPNVNSSSDKEPLKIVRRMAELGITLHIVVCEPSLSICCKNSYDSYGALTKITGGLVYPLTSASHLAEYIVGFSLERLELNALIVKEGKIIAHRAIFKQEHPKAIAEEYYEKYQDAGITVTTLDINHIHRENDKEAINAETYKASARTAVFHPLLNLFKGLFITFTNLVCVKPLGGDPLPEVASESQTAISITLSKKLISEEQTRRVIDLAITENAEVLDSEQLIARPTSEDPIKNCCRINVPPGWYGFVSGLSRMHYNQAIKLCYSTHGHSNTEFLTSEFGQADNIMRLKRTKEGFYLFTASQQSNIVLDTSFFWSRDKVKGSALDKPQYASQKLKVIQTQTPLHSRDFFPDYITYLIMAEDQPDIEQVAGVPDFNDCVGVVNLIKKTPMVYNDEA